ncbi:glycosyl hydrolase family 5 [Robertkochia marina]|uniref:Glycosyl hydrolase family 5 n=1 Tax=Robertkochia marina TaxID=1227945 RepID=A0A4S3M297_9FLAO|nr:cellulase family glycosylhydrolase [Robertkochia marina]THD67595.1 glycosyl hydrolase family 5 [Robertkochia marina]TRZ44536.1 glycosyl hydrolase family 5 [Robertkochia marina]
MQQIINRNLYRAILIISFIGVNALAVIGISSVWGYLNSGSDRTAMLHTEINSRQLYLPEVTWDTTAYEGRPMEFQNLQEIEKDYLNSWYVKNLALQSNKSFGINDYYTDSARVHIYKLIDYNKAAGVRFNFTTIEHHPKLQFYSADGQMVVFNDNDVVEYSESLEHNKIQLRTSDTASYRVMMLLEDGFWRVRHLQKLQQTIKEKPMDSSLDPDNAENTQDTARELHNIKGINYYPKDSPWDMFGDEFNAAIIEKDLILIKNSGLNTIRIFIPYEDFGAEHVKKQKLEKLDTVLNLATKNQLKVMVTLFDFYGDYSILNWTLTHEHLRQIVSRFKDHPALLGWDVKNEPDLDFKSRGKEMVLNWLKTVIQQVKKADPKHPVTIGWAHPENAVLLQEELDLVSFHFYRDIEELKMAYDELKKKVNKPLMLGEFGRSSYRGFWNPFGYDQDDQAKYHKEMQEFLHNEGIAFLSWTLYDFKEVPAGVVGRLPWRKAKQKNFGFIDQRGKKKKSYSHIAQ